MHKVQSTIDITMHAIKQENAIHDKNQSINREKPQGNQ